METLPEHLRAFVAVRLPESLLSELAAVQARLKDSLEGVSWTRREAMHLTLRFLGNVQSNNLPQMTDALAEQAGSHQRLQLRVRGVGSFGNRVIWAGIEGEEERLASLAHAIRGALAGFGDHEEERKFSAHITLGRCRFPARGLATKLAPFSKHDFGALPVDSVELIRSELSPRGSRYTTLAAIPLGR